MHDFYIKSSQYDNAIKILEILEKDSIVNCVNANKIATGIYLIDKNYKQASDYTIKLIDCMNSEKFESQSIFLVTETLISYLLLSEQFDKAILYSEKLLTQQAQNNRIKAALYFSYRLTNERKISSKLYSKIKKDEKAKKEFLLELEEYIKLYEKQLNKNISTLQKIKRKFRIN
ncbi:MAG: hypothetical protein R2852_10065 [Bacteroidia bacterium]